MSQKSFVAAGNILPRRFVKLASTENQIETCGANERVWGASPQYAEQASIPSGSPATAYAGTAGQPMTVRGEGEICHLDSGDDISYGDLLKSDADGKAVPAATTGTTAQEVGAIALSDAESGELVLAQIFRRPKVYPALA